MGKNGTGYGSEFQKQYLMDIPLVAYKDYDDSSKEMAIVIPLVNGLCRFENLPIYVHSSIAVRQSLVMNTDIVERQIPVYFLVDNTSPIDLREFLMQHGIPADRIRSFDPASPVVNYFRTSGCFYMLKDEVLREYKNLVKWDSDLFACCDPKIGDRFSTDIFQTGRIGCQIFGKKDQSYDEIAGWWDRWDWTDDQRTVKSDFEKTRRAVKDLSGYEIKARPFNKVVSTILTYPMERLPDSFHDFIFAIESGSGGEEVTLAIWSQCYGEEMDSIELPFVGYWNGIEKARQGGSYWAHFYIRGDYEGSHEREKSLFYRDIGAI